MPSTIALLIDAENVSYRDLDKILHELARQGKIILHAVYGDWENPTLQKWHELAKARKFKIRHQSSIPQIKNSSDMRLMMDAMEVLYRTTIDTFCIVSNDADFVVLCEKLRESQKYVIGMGYQHAAETLIRACNQFIFIGNGEKVSEKASSSIILEQTPKKETKPSDDTVNKVRTFA